MNNTMTIQQLINALTEAGKKIGDFDTLVYLVRHGYKVEKPANKLPEQDDAVFTPEDLDFEDMYQDDFRDVIIPVTL